MSSINNIYIKKATLETLLKGLEAKNQDGISIDVSISDEAGQYNNNIWAYVAQSKEDREAKKPRYTVGNGRTVWTDGVIKAIPYMDQSGAVTQEQAETTDDLPF